MMGEQCSEENLRKNNGKRSYQLVKDVTAVKQGKATTVQDRTGKCLTEERQILNRSTEYYSEPYNQEAMEIHQYRTVPRQTQRKGKSAGVKVPAQLVQAGGEDVITTLTTICDKIWQKGEWPTPWTQSLVITLPKKGNLQQCQNYRSISLINHPRKVMLKIILNGLKPQAEIIAEEQAGFRAGRNTTEQIFNVQILCETYLQHQQDLYHVFPKVHSKRKNP